MAKVFATLMRTKSCYVVLETAKSPSPSSELASRYPRKRPPPCRGLVDNYHPSSWSTLELIGERIGCFDHIVGAEHAPAGTDSGFRHRCGFWARWNMPNCFAELGELCPRGWNLHLSRHLALLRNVFTRSSAWYVLQCARLFLLRSTTFLFLPRARRDSAGNQRGSAT
jgi:hypothetical protein